MRILNIEVYDFDYRVKCYVLDTTNETLTYLSTNDTEEVVNIAATSSPYGSVDNCEGLIEYAKNKQYDGVLINEDAINLAFVIF